mgnify:FL=1
MLNDTVELYNPNGSMADYQIVGFLDDTKTSHLIAENLPIVVMTPEGLGTLAVSNANESYVAQFSHLCNIPDAINDIKAANHKKNQSKMEKIKADRLSISDSNQYRRNCCKNRC